MKQTEQGAALVLTMILIAVVSVMTVSMMFLAETETLSSHNYKLMSQARDAAEAGINKAANHILNNYIPPAATGADPLASYNYETQCGGAYPYPVQTAGNCSGHDIILSADSDVTANYPAVAKRTAFGAAGHGTLTAGAQTVNYKTRAKMLSLKDLSIENPTTGVPALRWEITSVGSIQGIQGAAVEVSAIMDQPVMPTFGYALFGTSSDCTPIGLNVSGGTTVDSYDSSQYTAGGSPPSSSNGGLQQSGGNVGTNGNLTLGGAGTRIYGSLSTPRTGVGGCASGAGETVNGNPGLSNGVVEMPAVIPYPPPPAPSPVPGTTSPQAISSLIRCNGVPGCSTIPPNTNSHVYRLTPTCTTGLPVCTSGTTYPNLVIGNGETVRLAAGTYNFNSLDLGSATLIIEGPVILNISGANLSTNGRALDMGAGTLVNSTYLAQNFQVLYAGDKLVRVRSSNTSSAGVVYAPNATIDLAGNGAWYGSLLGAAVNANGGAQVHYDRALGGKFMTAGPYLLQNFTWKKF